MSRHNLDAAGQGQPSDLIGALFDFETLPGRYPLTLREPRVLFDRSRDVLLLASGRLVKGLALDPSDTPGVQRAACFFVRMAILRPGADHYTLLGLQPSFNKETLREHYRMLIRLTHPDFAASSGAWPAGAATRINLANDVLSSVVRKAEYDGLLANDTRRIAPMNRLGAVLPRPMQRERHVTWGWILAFAGMVALGLTLWPSFTDDSYLVQVTSADFLVNDTEPGSAAKAVSRESREQLAQEIQEAQAAEKDEEAKGADALKQAEMARLDEAAQAVQAVQETQLAQKAEAAKQVEDAQLAEAENVAQAIKDAQAVKLAEAAREIQLAKKAEAVKLAEAATQSRVAKWAEATKVAQAAKEAQAAKIAQAAKEAQTFKLAQVAKLTPIARVAQEMPVGQVAATAASFKPLVVALQSPPSPAANEPAAKLSLADAQPALNQLIQAMQAGRGEDMLRGLDRSVRQSAGAAELVTAYNLLVGGSRSVRLGPVQLRGRPDADQLAVEGVVQLVLHDQGQPPPVRVLRLRALFAHRDGQVVITELSADGVQP